MPNKTLISNFNAMEDNDTLTYDTRTISKVFKNFLSSLAEFLLIKLPSPSDKYNLESVVNYYSSFTIADDFSLNKISENKVLKRILKIEMSKAVGIDKLSERFLRDAAEILSRPICEICNLSITRGVFRDACKIEKLKPIHTKTADLFLYFQSFLR